MKFLRIVLPILLFAFFVLLLFQSCYSVRLRSVNGAPMPDPLSTRTDYYRDMQVVELDTTIGIDLTTKDFTLLIKETDLCPTGKLHTVEYRSTLGGVLLSGITFGRKRRVRIKYVCMKPTN
ncbi:hypothetical protein WIW50_12655 [Flavobacteriaceae bacterium 3-367]|uniref:hypothetical protein n=1 Tax=Eudoraea algarum TaxID=3417568 RepID=UPI0032746810